MDDLDLALIEQDQEKDQKKHAALIEEQRFLEKTIVQMITNFTKMSGKNLQRGEKDIELLNGAINAHSVDILKALIYQGKLNPSSYRYGTTLLQNAIKQHCAEVVGLLTKEVDKDILEHNTTLTPSPLIHVADLIRAFDLPPIDDPYVPRAKIQQMAYLSMLTYLLEAGADSSVLKRYITPEDSLYNKDIATYVNEFNRAQTADLFILDKK